MRLGRFSASGTGLECARRLARVAALCVAPLLAGCWLRPDPPDLKDVAKDVTAQQIFWVVKNGINMTGMPSFGRVGAEDKEIWSIAAFVKKLPSVSDSDYKSWTAAPAAPAAAPAPPSNPQ